MKGIDLERYSILAVAKPDERTDLRHGELLCYRTRRVIAGPMMYLYVYPVARRALGKRSREKLGRATREAQERVNRRRNMDRLEQYMHANFDTNDLFLTMTYDDDSMPADLSEVRRDVKNYLARLRYRAKRAGRELKYIYVIELSERRDEDPNSRERWHVHMVLSGADRDTAEDAWPYGYGNSRRLQDSKERFTGIAKYMLKRRASWRTWEKTRNLVRPVERITDRQPSRRRVAMIARDVRQAGKEIFEKLYPDWELIEDADVRVSDYVPGAYIYARMRRRGRTVWRGGRDEGT